MTTWEGLRADARRCGLDIRRLRPGLAGPTARYEIRAPGHPAIWFTGPGRDAWAFLKGYETCLLLVAEREAVS